MMIAGGDSFQLDKADAVPAADPCRRHPYFSNCADFLVCLGFILFFFFLQELQGIHHVDCRAAVSCEYPVSLSHTLPSHVFSVCPSVFSPLFHFILATGFLVP